MRVISSIDELEIAKEEWYDRLSGFMFELVDLENVAIVLEAGCGSGSLTMPLMVNLGGRCRIIAYDLSTGPYEADLEVLSNKVTAKGLVDFIKTVKGDTTNMDSIADESIDLIVSNEFFWELNRLGLERTLREFHRVLKHGGQMVHAELSPSAQNRPQELLIEANLHYSLETMLPEGAYWFSPTVDDVAALMNKTGFRNISVHFFETNIRLVYEVAVEQLKRWKTNPIFMEKHSKDLQKHGIEFPLEHVIVCEKPRTG